MGTSELSKKLVSVMKECRRVEKNGFNDNQRYKYATSADVIAMVNEALTNNNIATVADVEVIQAENTTDGKGRKNNFVRVKMNITLIDADSGEEKIISGIGEGCDIADKAVAKAQTQALKYAYMSSFAIAQGDDPEDAQNEPPYFMQDEPPEGYYERPPVQSSSQNWEGDGKKIVGQCEDCGRDVNEKSAYYSRKKFDGAILCYNCQQKR